MKDEITGRERVREFWVRKYFFRVFFLGFSNLEKLQKY